MTTFENVQRAKTSATAIVRMPVSTDTAQIDFMRGFEQRLDTLLDTVCAATPLHAAMRYAALAPGKRTRPKLVLEIAGGTDAARDVACAIEMIHAASLILDDLPCMDDAQLRRGQATTHVVFGQPVAILAAVSLITHAFDVLAKLNIPQTQLSVLVRELSQAVGANGMSAGQVLDLDAQAKTLVSVESVNAMKTGALFVAAINMSAEIAQLGRREKAYLADSAAHLGLAFQLYDDIKDVLATEEEAGKPVGADKDKTNIVNQVGVDESWPHLLNRLVRAEKCFSLAGFDPARLRAVFAPLYDAL